MKNWASKIFEIKSEAEFNILALEAFLYQYNNVSVYNQYCKLIGVDPHNINAYTQIPFLPISFFKSHEVIVKDKEVKTIFTSSGTTGTITSKHLVSDLDIYIQSFQKAFELFYGSPSNYCICALLPSYLEREGSSLVFMADYLIKQSNHNQSGFYLDNYKELSDLLCKLDNQGQKVLLLGVTYALLDLAENYPIQLNNTIIMETGGMKGRRKEIVREELHRILLHRLGVSEIHSEYGMTELLSQAYSIGDGVFNTPAWMKIIIRDTYDPYAYMSKGRSGAINIIDLANINSCCFIETSDLGRINADGSFTILGRFDYSEIRGCNLMVAG